MASARECSTSFSDECESRRAVSSSSTPKQGKSRASASTLSRAGRPLEAAEALRQVTLLEPWDDAAWLRLGMEWSAAGLRDSAVVAYRTALEKNPDSPDAMNELARLLLTAPAGRREAFLLLERSLELRPDQQHAAEMREALERLGEQGYGEERP